MTASREVQHDSFMDSPPTSPTPETEYLPESDGKPMAETDVHRTQMIELLECLAEYYRADPRVYVTGNIFLYFRNHEGERQSISPDIFVVRGVEKKLRRSGSKRRLEIDRHHHHRAAASVEELVAFGGPARPSPAVRRNRHFASFAR